MSDNSNTNKQIDGIQPNREDIKKSRNLVLTSIGEKIQEEKPKIKRGVKNIDGLSSPVPRMIQNQTKNVSTEIFPEIKKNEQNNAKASKTIEKAKKPIPKRPQEKKEIIKKNIKKIDKKFKEKEDFRETIKRFIPSIKSNLKKIMLHSLLFLSVFIFLYFFLSFLILYCGVKSPLALKLSDKLNIPAVISKDGIINYAEYIKISETASSDTNALNQKIAIYFIMDRLYKKHGTKDMQELQDNLAFDQEVNIVAYNRIKKIKDTINEEKNFIKVAQKFGEVGQITVSPENINSYDFAAKLGNIEQNETSDIITTANGYYIVHCFLKENKNLSLSYVFIPSINIEEYLQNEISGYEYWKLIKKQ